ncbi:MAG: hypothetical protein ACJ8E5_02120 [Xanthobacteraceae bacterium]
MQRDIRVSLVDDVCRCAATARHSSAMSMTGTPDFLPHEMAMAIITWRRSSLGRSHICMIDSENTFDTSDDAADSAADDGADRASDPAALVSAMHNPSGHALSVRRDCHHHEHCRPERYTEFHHCTPADSSRSGDPSLNFDDGAP